MTEEISWGTGLVAGNTPMDQLSLEKSLKEL